MKIKWKPFIISLAIPLVVGALAGVLSGGGMQSFEQMNQPPLSPPGWLFPIVWSALYLLMGYASYRVYVSDGDKTQKRNALILYGIQLFLNFLWPLVFFGLGWYLTAFWLLLLLWIAIFLTIRAFSAIDEQAGDLLLPYILWVSFAGYLNLGVYLLN
jgi:tryptophan-rich sensory protein